MSIFTSKSSDPASRLIGTLLAGEFRIQALIGRGGMGAVYLAVQENLGRRVAIKIILPDQASTHMAQLRFNREARAVAALNHPGIAQVYKYGRTEEGANFLVMEFVDGGSFADYRVKRPPLRELLLVMDRILDALAFTHARQIFHRDLKPDNILLARDDDGNVWPKLVDFGIASMAEAEQKITQTGIALGTPRYMSPEQARGQRVGPPADLYALTVMVYEVLAGRTPFSGDSAYEVMQAKVSRPPPNLVSLPEYALSDELIQVLMKGLETDPEKRYRLAADYRRALAPHLRDLAEVGSPTASGTGWLPPGMGTDLRDLEDPHASGGIAPSDPTFVGRSDERAKVEEVVRRTAEEGAPQFMLIEGDGGIGKTSFADWIRIRVEELGWMQTLRGAYSEAGASYRDGLRGILDDFLNVSGESRGMVEFAVRNFLGDAAAEDPTEIEALTDYMRPSAQPNLALSSHPKQTTFEGPHFALLERTLRRIAADNPLMIFLDDLHWGGRQPFDFIHHLMTGLELNPAPILVLGTVRSDMRQEQLQRERARFDRYSGVWFHSLKLGPMSDEDVREMLAPAVPDERHRRVIAARAAGNPLYAVQLARVLDDPDARERILDGGALPPSLRNILEAQLDRAIRTHENPRYLRSLLQRIALLGARIPVGLLEFTVKKEGGDLDKLLEEVDLLVDKGVLTDVPGADGELIEFTHGLLRDTLIAEVSGRRARRLHGRVAQIKEAWYSERLPEVAAELAVHYVKSGEHERAAELLDKAIRHHVGRGRIGDAAELCTELARMLGDRPSESGAAWLRAARLYWDDGDTTSSRRCLDLTQASNDPGVRVGSDILQSRLLIAAGRVEEARSLLDRAGDALSSTGLEDQEREKELWVDWVQADADVLEGQGYPEAAALRLDEVIERNPRPRQMMELLRRSGWAHFRCGHYDHAQERFERALNTSVTTGDTSQQAWALFSLHQLRAHMGNESEAADLLARAEDAAMRAGSRRLVSRIMLARGDIARHEGRSSDAEAIFRKQANLAHDIGDDKLHGQGLLRLAMVLNELGRDEEAGTVLEEAAGTARRSGDPGLQVASRLVGAARHARAGRVDSAREEFSGAQQVTGSWPGDPDTADNLEAIADAVEKLPDVPSDLRREALNAAAELRARLGQEERAEELRRRAESTG